MSRQQCCVWGCSNKKGKCPEDISGNRLCDCPLPQNKGCHRGEYLTMRNIHSMPELVKRAVIEKINHNRQGSQRIKWKPSQEAFICNVHYADFKLLFFINCSLFSERGTRLSHRKAWSWSAVHE